MDIALLLDESACTGYQKWLVALTAVSIIFDGVDSQVLGTAIPAIMREWSVPRASFAPVIAGGLIGMMLGGAAAGLAGDRVGRKSARLGSIALFGLATAAAALAGGLTSLVSQGSSRDWVLAAPCPMQRRSRRSSSPSDIVRSP